MRDRQSTHFGFQQVLLSDKVHKVREVFDSVADRYDLMNDLMSFGIHRLWKRRAIDLSGVRRGHRVLDLASGTGDLAQRFATIVGADGLVLVTDINAAMLQRGRRRMLDEGIAGNVGYAQVNAESLPFPDASIDCISIGFGLRNVTDKGKALRAMFRALRPGGRLLVLEFSKPVTRPLQLAYDVYSFGLLPRLGALVARDERSYRYLAESIRMHPDQDALKQMMESAGFEHCDYLNLTGGIVAIHRGFKF